MSIIVLNEDTNGAAKDVGSTEIVHLLRKAMLTLKSNFMSEDGSSVDYKSMSLSDAFSDYKELAKKLCYVNLDQMVEEERKAFFINLYNIQMIHALVALESLPETPLGVQGMWSNFAYNVSGLLFTLDEIEHGILRCNKGHPNDNKPKFEADDPRKKLVLSNFDPRIHFALNCGANSCPPIRIYSHDKLEHQLNIAATSFCNQEVQVKESGKTILLSKLLLWYKLDFGQTDTEVLEKLCGYITNDELKQEVLKVISTESTEEKIAFKDYNWQLNAK